MVDILTTHTGESAHGDVFAFARSVYNKRIYLDLTRRPDVFVYAQDGTTIVGCIGVYRGDTQPELFFEMCDPPGVYERLAGKRHPPRRQCGELGARITAVPKESSVTARDISIAVTACSIIVARGLGIRYLGGVTNPLVRAMTDGLGLELIRLGTPNFSTKGAAFLKNMEIFLRARPICAGLRLDSVSGCRASLCELEKKGVTTHVPAYAREHVLVA